MKDCAKYVTTLLVQKLTAFEHACEHHPTYVGELSSGAVVTTLNEDSSDSIFSMINCISNCNSLWF